MSGPKTAKQGFRVYYLTGIQGRLGTNVGENSAFYAASKAAWSRV